MNTIHLIPIDLIKAKQSIEDICIMGAICKDSKGKEVLSSLNNYLQKIWSSIKETHFKKIGTISTNKQDETLPHILNKGLTDALEIIVEELNKSSVRKYTCINGMGYSQLERDIVEKLTNWQKEKDKVIIDKLIEALEKTNNEYNYSLKLLAEAGGLNYSENHFSISNKQLLQSLK